MRNKEWSVFRKTTAVILTATLVLISAACGKGGNAAESDLSNEDGSGSVTSGIPGGGKWVDSDVVFTVTINYVSEMPEMTDEIAEKMSDGEYKTLEEYRESIRAEIQEGYDEDHDNQ